MSELLVPTELTVGINACKRLSGAQWPEDFSQSSHLAWLNEWLSKMGHGAPDARMLQTLILRSPSYFGLRAISIMILDENDDAHNFASHGYPAEAIKLQNMYTTIEEKLPSVDAMLTGKVVALKNRSSIESYSTYLTAWASYVPWLNSLFAFPLLWDERLCGSVVWSFDNPNALDEFGNQLFTALTSILQSMMSNEFDKTRSVNPIGVGANTQLNALSQDDGLRRNYRMSDRQIEIATLIAAGATNREISKKLFFSESTARYETVKIYERLQVKNRAQAAAIIRSATN